MKKFNILLVGCGGMANTWIQYLLKRGDVELMGLCDIIYEKAIAMKEKYDVGCETFPDIVTAFKSGIPFNLAVDCTTPESHEEVVTYALSHGCDVIGEKPMAVTREGAWNQIKTADEYGKTYAVMQNRIYLPGMRAIREAVNENLIGRLGTVSSDFFIGAHFGGFRDLMDNVLILDMAIHTFYQARFLIGANPVSVYCHEFNPPGSWYKGNASAVAIFEFDNGVVYDYRGSWCSEGFNTTWECDWRLIGENGTIKWNGADKPKVQLKINEGSHFIYPVKDTEIDKPYLFDNVGHFGCFDEMFKALIENRRAETDCHDNYYSMNMVYGAIESAKYGKKVMLV